MEQYQEKYKNFTTIDLLTIVREGDQYRPEALAAAKAELSNRNISMEEVQEVDTHFAKKDAFNATIDKIKNTPDHFLNYLEPLKDDAQRYTPEGWLRMFVILQIVVGTWQMYFLTKDIWGIIKGRKQMYTAIEPMLIFGSFVLIPVSIYLLIKKSVLGWAFVFASAITSILFQLQLIYLYFKYSNHEYLSQVYTLKIHNIFWLIVFSCFAVFLLQPKVKALFGVTNKVILNTVLGVASFILFLLAFAKVY